ncbi:MAG: hypothetical protein P4L51_06280 [Puia sp.]|nr:hypothetical protein [Puia sp.]
MKKKNLLWGAGALVLTLAAFAASKPVKKSARTSGYTKTPVAGVQVIGNFTTSTSGSVTAFFVTKNGAKSTLFTTATSTQKAYWIP